MNNRLYKEEIEIYIFRCYQQGEEKDSDNENDRVNGLRIKNRITIKEERFSFFAYRHNRKAVCRHTLHTFANRICQITNRNLQKSEKILTKPETYY